MENQEKSINAASAMQARILKTIKRNTRSSTRKNMRIPYQG